MVPTSTSSGAKTLLGDRYEVLSAIGSGAAANVFRVRDLRTGLEHAAKVLKPANAANPEILARFEDEHRILKSMRHPHLPEVHDFGFTDEGGRFLVMDLVEGDALDAYFRSRPQDIWVLLHELCETLSFIHAHNLLHQDIKPSNILVTRTRAFGRELPVIKLIDFGLTYRRDAGASVKLVGTAEYVAPEVVRGEAPLTRAVDYYSLGVTLYELLCGTPPFTGPARDVLRAHLDREPLIEEEHLEWAELYPHVRALLTKDRRARLEAFEELRRAVVSRLTGGVDELDRAYATARSALRTGSTAAKVRVIPGLQEAQELELAGDIRAALKAYLRLLNACDARDLDSIEKICTNAQRAAKSRRKYRLIGRYFLKRRVAALWARNMYIAAYRAIHEWAGGSIDRVPSSLIPRYARGVMYLRGARVARRLVEERLTACRSHSAPTTARLLIDLSLFAYHSGDFDSARDSLLAAGAEKTRLTNSDRYRVSLYQIMIMNATGNTRDAVSAATKHYRVALRLGCVDEALMFLWMRGHGALQGARWKDLVDIVKVGLRLSHRAGLVLREAEFRAMAGTAYFIQDDYPRSFRHNQAAMSLAQLLEQSRQVAHHWVSLGMACESMGRLGDARRYSERALRLIDKSHVAAQQVKARLLWLELMILLDDAKANSYMRKTRPFVESHARQSERGYFHFLSGEIARSAGQLSEALLSFEIARHAYEQSGAKDDSLRAVIMLARVHAELGSRKAASSCLEASRRQVARIDSPLLRAEYALLQLETAYLRREGRSVVRKRVDECSQALRTISEVPTRLKIMRQMGRVYARLGARREHEELTREFTEVVRIVVANLNSDDEARGFLSRVEVRTLGREAESLAAPETRRTAPQRARSS